MVHFFLSRFFQARNLVCLGPLGSLDDIELNLITLFEALVALALDRTVMDEDVSPALAAEEAVTFCVVKPLNGALVLCQVSHSLVFVSETTTSREVKVLQR